MLETDKVFAGSIPENYNRYMVPLIFEPFAADLAQRAASLSPSAVLETAAGTGVVTRALAPKLSPDASYIVTDLNQPMLDYAASRQAPDFRVSTDRQGKSGLGLEAQRASVLNYLNGGTWDLVEEFVEVESGKHSDRPRLACLPQTPGKAGHCQARPIVPKPRLHRHANGIRNRIRRR
jgi:hypothetical protein